MMRLCGHEVRIAWGWERMDGIQWNWGCMGLGLHGTGLHRGKLAGLVWVWSLRCFRFRGGGLHWADITLGGHSIEGRYHRQIQKYKSVQIPSTPQNPQFSAPFFVFANPPGHVSLCNPATASATVPASTVLADLPPFSARQYPVLRRGVSSIVEMVLSLRFSRGLMGAAKECIESGGHQVRISEQCTLSMVRDLITGFHGIRCSALAGLCVLGREVRSEARQIICKLPGDENCTRSQHH